MNEDRPNGISDIQEFLNGPVWESISEKATALKDKNKALKTTLTKCRKELSHMKNTFVEFNNEGYFPETHLRMYIDDLKKLIKSIDAVM